MKTQTLLASIALALAGSAFATGDGHVHTHERKAMHGGVVVASKGLDYELVAKPTLIQLHLRENGKPADVSKASAKLTLLNGAEKQELQLTPVADSLQAAGSFKVGPGTKVVAVVTMGGKPAGTVRFALK